MGWVRIIQQMDLAIWHGELFREKPFQTRIFHFLVKSIQKQLDKLNKNKSEDVQLENKNLPEFQYPTNLTPFYLHWKCSISENANTRTVEQEGIPGRSSHWPLILIYINSPILAFPWGRAEYLVLCYIVVSVFTGGLVKLNNFPNKDKMISFPQYLERL